MSSREIPPGELEPDDLAMLRYAFGRAAHDLNNYLSGLLGYLGLVKGLVKDRLSDVPDCARYFGFIEKSAGRLAALLKALADFGEPAGPAPTPIDANVVVRGAVAQAVESSKGELEVRFEPDETLPRVAARAGSLGEAVRHLLINALEASTARPATVTVRTGRAEPPSDLLVPAQRTAAEWVRIDVEDHGAGMDEEAARHCVVPFYTTKRATDQHGLGLALASSYAYAWGGGLDVRSRPGAGTTVSIYLPVAQP